MHALLSILQHQPSPVSHTHSGSNRPSTPCTAIRKTHMTRVGTIYYLRHHTSRLQLLRDALLCFPTDLRVAVEDKRAQGVVVLQTHGQQRSPAVCDLVVRQVKAQLIAPGTQKGGRETTPASIYVLCRGRTLFIQYCYFYIVRCRPLPQQPTQPRLNVPKSAWAVFWFNPCHAQKCVVGGESNEKHLSNISCCLPNTFNSITVIQQQSAARSAQQATTLGARQKRNYPEGVS